MCLPTCRWRPQALPRHRRANRPNNGAGWLTTQRGGGLVARMRCAFTQTPARGRTRPTSAHLSHSPPAPPMASISPPRAAATRPERSDGVARAAAATRRGPNALWRRAAWRRRPGGEELHAGGQGGKVACNRCRSGVSRGCGCRGPPGKLRLPNSAVWGARPSGPPGRDTTTMCLQERSEKSSIGRPEMGGPKAHRGHGHGGPCPQNSASGRHRCCCFSLHN